MKHAILNDFFLRIIISEKLAAMANLILHNVYDAIVNALKVRASQHGISVEAEHRRILEQALLRPRRKSFLEVLRDMPDVGGEKTSRGRMTGRWTCNHLGDEVMKVFRI